MCARYATCLFGIDRVCAVWTLIRTRLHVAYINTFTSMGWYVRAVWSVCVLEQATVYLCITEMYEGLFMFVTITASSPVVCVFCVDMFAHSWLC